MGLLDSIGGYLGNEENRLRLASGFNNMSGNPNAGNIQAGINQRLKGIGDNRKLKAATGLEADKLKRQTVLALQILGDKYPDISNLLKGGLLTPKEAMDESKKPPAERKMFKGADSFNYYTDDQSRVLPNAVLPSEERRIINGADGFNYYADDQSRVLPNAVAPTPKGTAVMQNYQFYKDQGKTDDEALKLSTSGQTINVGGEKQTEGQKQVDKAYAKDYLQWTMGGGADMSGQLAQVGSVLAQLENGDSITGPMIGTLGSYSNLALSILKPKAGDAKEKVEEVVQRNLKIILGAQFTEKEGQLLISRAYNPALQPEQNAARLRKLVLQMQTAVTQRNSMSKYFEENGTLAGYKGERPSVNDFYEALSGFKKGQVVQGFEFLGGDHSIQTNWRKL